MSEELLSLKWNNHHSHFVNILSFLRDQEVFIDATLACNGKLYSAHKFVLSTCSDYFKEMLVRHPAKHPIIFMKDVTSADLEALLDFMYNGEVNVPQSSLGSLIKTAEALQIKGLAIQDDPPSAQNEVPRPTNASPSPPPKRIKVKDFSAEPFTPMKSTMSAPPPKRKLPLQPLQTNYSVVGDKDNHLAGVDKPHISSSPASSDSQHFHSDSLDGLQVSENVGSSSGAQKAVSKEEGVDIKQEDVTFVEDDDDDQGTWNIGDEGMDGSLSEPMSYPGMLLPHSESGPLQEDSSSVSGPQVAAAGVCAEGVLAWGSALHAKGEAPHPEEDTAPPFLLPNSESAKQTPLFMSAYETGTSRSPPAPARGGSSSGPRVCHVCGKVFPFNSTFVKHLRIHTGEKPFFCLYCSYRTAQSSNLNSHLRTVHKYNPGSSHPFASYDTTTTQT